MSLQAYNSATDTLTPIAENDYKDSLEEISVLPTASADLLNKCYLLIANQVGYVKGGIYQCQLVEASYEWVLVSQNPLEAGKGITIEDDTVNADTNVFNGTLDEWEALTAEEQANYSHIATPEEASEELHNKVYTLLSTSVTTTATNYTLMLNRKLSDYDYLIIQQMDATSVRNSYIVHLNQFESKRVTLSSLHGTNSASASDYSVSTLNVSYVDDTTISAYATGSAMINTLEILGVKITM